MRCAKCGTAGIPGKKFCAECGNPLSNRCSNCGSDNAPAAKFCGDCGNALSQSVAAGGEKLVAQASPGVSSSPEAQILDAIEGERKTVTALFADIKGSTELMEDLDPEEARAIIDPALKLMIDAVQRYDGYVVQSTGDGIFALFGAPVAHEDHPQRALYAALRMQEGLKRYSDRIREEGQLPLYARVGANTGEVVVRSIQTGAAHTEYTPIGHTANLASRLQTLAPAGSIAVSEYTRKLIEGYFAMRSLGPMAVRGIGEPIEVYEVTALGDLRTHFELSTRRGLTRFVGREGELAQMSRALELAMGGNGQIVAVMAEAGTGKSRLFYEFKATIPAACRVLEAYSVSHGKASAWLPVLELLRGYFGLHAADDATVRRCKIREAISKLDSALNDALPYLFGLLGVQEIPDPLAQMDPRIKHQRTFDVIKRALVRESLNQPAVVLFEDLHWIDGETQSLLDLLADSIGTAKILLLFNYRPEYSHQWGSKTYYTQLRLDPLDQPDANTMLRTLLGDDAQLVQLKGMIIELTGGNPFFIEEMVQGLFAEGALARNGVVKVTRPLTQLRLPPTVQGILAARIDRLPPEEKNLLQTLAVIGRSAPLALLSEVALTSEERLGSTLASLQSAEFVYEQAARSGTDYVFKHALTQQAAYESLLVERRKQIHERVGHAIESRYTDHLDDHLGELARHYSHSGNTEKAVEYLGRSGQQSMQRCSYADAIKSVSEALDRLKTLPDHAQRAGRELSLQLTLGASLMTTKGWAVPEVAEAFGRAQELCSRMGEVPQLVPALYGIWGFFAVRGELERARLIGLQLLGLAEATKNPVLTIAAHYALGTTLYWTGDLEASERHLSELMESYVPGQHPAITALFGADLGIVGIAYSSMDLWLMGYPERALERIRKAVRMARDVAHPESLAWALAGNSIVHRARHEGRQSRVAAEEVFSVCESDGLVMQSAVAKLVHGWVLAVEGNPGRGCVEIREAFKAFDAPGLVLMEAEGHVMLAEAYWYAGNAEEGLLSLEEPLTRTKSEEQNFASELCRIRGELLLLRAGMDRMNVSGDVEALFREALEIARKQSAKSLELRAAMSLARLLRDTNRRAEAYTMLSTIYNWFTEGFDTADLKDAKALLDELSA